MESNGLQTDRFLTVGALGHSVAGSEFELQSSSKRWAWNNRPGPGGCLLMGENSFPTGARDQKRLRVFLNASKQKEK